jgi:hypothetical protein
MGAAIVAARPYDKEYPTPANDYVKSLRLLSAVEVYNPKVRLGANELALEAAQALHLPGVGGSDARGSIDELGFAATLFVKPVEKQADLVAALLGGEFYPVEMGELPPLRRPGEARTEEVKAKKKKRRWPR